MEHVAGDHEVEKANALFRPCQVILPQQTEGCLQASHEKSCAAAVKQKITHQTLDAWSCTARHQPSTRSPISLAICSPSRWRFAPSSPRLLRRACLWHHAGDSSELPAAGTCSTPSGLKLSAYSTPRSLAPSLNQPSASTQGGRELCNFWKLQKGC